jgi:pimeloyl-ACP methyl ester carboxylesterase
MLAAGGAAMLAAAGTSMGQTVKSANFVMVHGAWHGGWAWKKVRPLLRAAGHDVFTPTLTGLGERRRSATRDTDLDTHVQDILDMLEYEDLRDVILVGHSYAGMVITGVANRDASRLAHVVYLDAFLPEEGKSLNDYVPGFVAQYEKGVQEAGDGWRLPFDRALSFKGLGVTDPADLAWMTPRMTDQPYKTFTQKLAAPTKAPGKLRQSYLLSSERPHYLAAAERAARRGIPVIHVPGAGHDVMVTQPEDLVKALLAL